jgi:hypothetical protein
MAFEYWFCHNYQQYRFRLEDIGESVDVESGASSASDFERCRFGGEMGYQWVSHKLAQGLGRISFFSGMCNWREVGKPRKALNEHDANLMERRAVLCFVLGDEAFVVLGKDGKPEMRLISAGLAMPVNYSQAIQDGVLVDFAKARSSLESKKRDTRMFPGTPPSPYN